MRLKTTFNVVVLSVLSFGYYRIVTFTDISQRSFEVARATYNISQEEEKVDDFETESSSEVIRRRQRKRPGLLDSDSDSNDSD